MILVHVCCSVDSHYFLQRLQKDFLDEKIVCFFYDPNIHPFSEYKLRLLDVEYSCKKLGIELIEGEYDYNSWLNSVKGLENEPEKGARCTVCFDKRLEVTVKKAIQLKVDKFSTTLLMSPKKSQEKLLKIGKNLEKQFGIEFIFKDYRSGNGTQEQSKIVKENKIYRQDYCGCLFGLTQQRMQQNIFMDEMICSVDKRVMPASIEERINLFKKRNKLAEIGIDFKIIKERFLNYRILRGFVKKKKEIIPSYFLAYSTIKNKKAKGKVEFEVDEIYYFNRNEIKIITLKTFNKLINSNYKNIYELYKSPPSIEKEINLRKELFGDFSLCAIIILEEIFFDTLEIYLDSIVYEDTKDKIIKVKN